MWIPDLAPCSRFARLVDARFVAVGWLAADHEYTRGDVSPDVVQKLSDLLIEPWEPATAMGWHDCELCPEGSASVGYRNLLVPGERRVYLAPELILHYVERHGYQPPEEFCRAVRMCPPMGSREYHDALFAAGGPRVENAHYGALEDGG